MIVSDHGFLGVSQLVNPMVLLSDAGLITTNADGKLTDWKVYMHNGGGSFFLEVRDPADTASIAKATALMRELAADSLNGISKVYTPDDLKVMNAAPEAFLALGARKGFAFGSALEGALGHAGGGGRQARLRPEHSRAAGVVHHVGRGSAGVSAARGCEHCGRCADGGGAARRADDRYLRERCECGGAAVNGYAWGSS